MGMVWRSRAASSSAALRIDGADAVNSRSPGRPAPWTRTPASLPELRNPTRQGPSTAACSTARMKA